MTRTSAVRIRSYRPRDLTTLMALFRASVHGIAHRDYTQAQLAAWVPADLDSEAWASRLAANHARLAEEGERIVGFAELSPSGHVDMLFVAPDRQRRGIARVLLRPFGSSPKLVIAGMMAITAVMSMFMSNTATFAPRLCSRRVVA